MDRQHYSAEVILWKTCFILQQKNGGWSADSKVIWTALSGCGCCSGRRKTGYLPFTRKRTSGKIVGEISWQQECGGRGAGYQHHNFVAAHEEIWDWTELYELNLKMVINIWFCRAGKIRCYFLLYFTNVQIVQQIFHMVRDIFQIINRVLYAIW